MIRPSIQDKVKVSSGWKPLITRFPFDQNSGTAIKYSDRVKSGVTGEQIWLQINEPTPNDKGKYVMELFDGKTGHQKMVDLSGQGKRVLCRLEPKVEIAVAVVQLLSCAQLFAAPWTAAHQASLSFNSVKGEKQESEKTAHSYLKQNLSADNWLLAFLLSQKGGGFYAIQFKNSLLTKIICRNMDGWLDHWHWSCQLLLGWIFLF